MDDDLMDLPDEVDFTPADIRDKNRMPAP